MTQAECFKKEKIIKEDGRYLIYYDFTPERPAKDGKKPVNINGEERK